LGRLNVPRGAVGGGEGGSGGCGGGEGGVGDVCDAAARGRADAGEALVELAQLRLHALDGGPPGLLRVFERSVEDDVVAALEHPTAGDALLLRLATGGRAEDGKVVVVGVVGSVVVDGSEGSVRRGRSSSRSSGRRLELAEFVDIHGIVCDDGGWRRRRRRLQGASLLGSFCLLLGLFDRVGEGAVCLDDLVDGLGARGAGDGDRGP
jgi:hypothetical protein